MADKKPRAPLDWGGMLWAALKMTIPIGGGHSSLELTTKVLQQALLGTTTAPADHQVMQQKLNGAMTALSEASAYMGELENKLAVQKQNLDNVMASYSHYQQLANTEKSKADAFIHEMAVKINEGAAKERMWAFAINIVAGILVFVLGVIASDKVHALFSALRRRF